MDRPPAAPAPTDGLEVQVTTMMYEDDYADEEWVEDEGNPEDDILACPSCGNAVHEDTQQCPHCGDWITPIWPGTRSKRLVWIVAATIAILGLLAVTLC